MADSLVFAESVDSESNEPIFTDKQWLYVNDSNNSSYQGQIVIDTTSLSNSGQYMGWNEAFIAMPLVLQMQSGTVAAPSANMALVNPLDFGLAMKSGFWQILHSMSVEFNNTSVVQTSNFLNVFSSFKNLTSWSDEDLKNWGCVTGFFPDTATSWIWNSAANAGTNFLGPNGTGLSNNRNAYYTANFLSTAAVLGLSTPVTSFSASKQQCVNLGMLQRQRWLVFGTNDGTYNTYAAAINSGNAAAQKSLLLATASTATNVSSITNAFMSYVRATASSRAIVFNAIIRLKDVCDFFAKTPLLKGSTMRIYLNTNQCLCSVNVYGSAITDAGVVTAGSMALESAPVILGGGATCPFMLASTDLGQGLAPSVINPVSTAAIAAAALVQYKVACSIVRTQFVSDTLTEIQSPITAVRLYCPAYSMSPQAEARYLSMSQTKKIVYNDFFNYSIANQSGAFNVLVSNGLPNLRSCLIVPTIERASNGTVGATNWIGVLSNTLQSPFSSTGGTPDPIMITDFQVQLSGKNVFNANQLYDFENFVEQIVQTNQLNGSLTTGLGSGQIGFTEWTQLYRYLYANASRGLPQDMGVAKSVQIQGTIRSPATCTLLVFLEFERSVTVNVASGQIVGV